VMGIIENRLRGRRRRRFRAEVRCGY
jgi:hypothetical protein